LTDANWARRPKEDEPIAEQRSFTDEEGRRWTGTVTSGRLEGGEENAEVIFVCEDQPSELKRVADLGVAPRAADDTWRRIGEDEVEAVFRRSRPA
jgi:hypothetical protein